MGGETRVVGISAFFVCFYDTVGRCSGTWQRGVGGRGKRDDDYGGGVITSIILFCIWHADNNHMLTNNKS